MPKRHGRELVAVVALVLLVSLGVTPASGSDCASPVREQVIFVRSNNFPVFGSQGSVVEADRALAFDCPNAENHHTAHVRDSAFASFAEVGYVEDWTVGTTHRFRVFWEVGYGSTIVGGFSSGQLITCCQTIKFRVVNEPQTNRWKFFFAYGTAGFAQIGPGSGQDAGFHQAYPFSEVGRRGDPGTNAVTSQSNLLYKAVRNCTSNCWTSSWSTNFQHNPSVNCIPGYEYIYVAANRWRTQANTSHTC